MAKILADVWAGTAHMFHGHLEWLALQIFVTTAEREFLIQLAAERGFTPTPATFASGTVEVAGTNGTDIDAGTVFVRDDGETYEVTTLATIAGGVASCTVQAVTAGVLGNLDEGESLTLESTIPGVDSVATVEAGGIDGGVDEEGTEDFRARYLLHLREPPTGGNDQDYEAWALAVAGVTRAWVYRNENGLGTVAVRFVTDNEDPIYPDVGEVAAVQAAIDDVRPTTAEVLVASPVNLSIDLSISITPDTAEIRSAIEDELDDLFYREGIPSDGVGRGTVYLSQIRTAIGIASGLEDFTLAFPVADVAPPGGEMASRGAILWV